MDIAQCYTLFEDKYLNEICFILNELHPHISSTSRKCRFCFEWTRIKMLKNAQIVYENKSNFSNKQQLIKKNGKMAKKNFCKSVHKKCFKSESNCIYHVEFA